MDATSILFGAMITITTGIVIGIIVLIVEYKTNIFVKKTKRELSAILVWESSLINVLEGYEKDFDLSWKGRTLEIPQVSQIIIRIANEGTEPIQKTDFDTPLKLTAEKGKILSVGVHKSDLPLSVSLEDQNVLVKPLLLNSGDYFTLSLLVNGDYKIEVDARIVGISEIKARDDYTARRYPEDKQAKISMIMLITLLAIILGAFTFMVYIAVEQNPIPIQ